MTEHGQQGGDPGEPQEPKGNLILTRKVHQGLLASNGVQVDVLGVERDRVKLGLRAPAGMLILRGELDPSDVRRSNSGERGTGGGYLILVRKVHQFIKIGDDMQVRVLGVERDRVKVGIHAPKNVNVMRSELVSQDEKAAFLQSGRTQQ